MTKTALLLIAFGIVFSSWNLYSFLLGYTASTEVKADQILDGMSTDIKTEETIPLYTDIPDVGEKIGELTIPKLEKAFPIYQGTNEEVLKKGVGHLVKSVLPGEKNNSILSGHRETVFRGLQYLQVHDQILVSTHAGDFLYKVKKIRVVDADDTTAMKPRPNSTLTLTTCYPFDFIGSAPQRYIIHSDLISSNLSEEK